MNSTMCLPKLMSCEEVFSILNDIGSSDFDFSKLIEEYQLSVDWEKEVVVSDMNDSIKCVEIGEQCEVEGADSEEDEVELVKESFESVGESVIVGVDDRMQNLEIIFGQVLVVSLEGALKVSVLPRGGGLSCDVCTHVLKQFNYRGLDNSVSSVFVTMYDDFRFEYAPIESVQFIDIDEFKILMGADIIGVDSGGTVDIVGKCTFVSMCIGQGDIFVGTVSSKMPVFYGDEDTLSQSLFNLTGNRVDVRGVRVYKFSYGYRSNMETVFLTFGKIKYLDYRSLFRMPLNRALIGVLGFLSRKISTSGKVMWRKDIFENFEIDFGDDSGCESDMSCGEMLDMFASVRVLVNKELGFLLTVFVSLVYYFREIKELQWINLAGIDEVVCVTKVSCGQPSGTLLTGCDISSSVDYDYFLRKIDNTLAEMRGMNLESSLPFFSVHHVNYS